MILVDTSVWIDYFKCADTEHTQLLDEALKSGIVAVGDLIVLEILQGFKLEKDYKLAKAALDHLDQFELLGNERAIQCAMNYRALRKKGITIRKTADLIIATFCIENRIPLLFSDRDFHPFVRSLGLQPATA